MAINSISLHELNTFIKRTIALNFSEPVYLRAEILSLNIKKGHTYATLVEKDPDGTEIIAQLNAVLWNIDRLQILKNIPDMAGYFVPGHQVLLAGYPVFHEKFGFQFQIKNIDISYTQGALEIHKNQLFLRIKAENLDTLNKARSLPLAFTSMAIISSAGAAGYADFMKHIQFNNFGLKFQTRLFESVMQGQNLEEEILSSLGDIAICGEFFDCVIIIRGGGSKVDLSGFDNYKLAYAIAHYHLPILTGIGHDIDISAADLAAGKSFKTPTDVAAFIIEKNISFLWDINQHGENIQRQSGVLIKRQYQDLKNLNHEIKTNSFNLIGKKRFEIIQLVNKLISEMQKKIQSADFEINRLHDHIRLNNPLAILERGYALIYQQKNRIISQKEFDKSKRTTIYFHDGNVEIP